MPNGKSLKKSNAFLLYSFPFSIGVTDTVSHTTGWRTAGRTAWTAETRPTWPSTARDGGQQFFIEFTVYYFSEEM